MIPTPIPRAEPKSLDPAAVNRYVGCFRFRHSSLPDGQLEAYLAPSRAVGVARLQAYLHPSPLNQNISWTVEGGLAVFSWTTGESAVTIRLDGRTPMLTATGEHSSDVVVFPPRPPPRVDLEVARPTCAALETRKLEIFAAAANLEARRAASRRSGAGQRASHAADLARLRDRFGISTEALRRIAAEGHREHWAAQPECNEEPRFGAGIDPRWLAPAPLPHQPAPPPGVCRRGRVDIVGVVTAEGAFTDPRADSSSRFAWNPEVIEGAIDVILGSTWLPALVCGRTVAVQQSTTVDVYWPCKPGEAQEPLRVGGDVLSPIAIERVYPSLAEIESPRWKVTHPRLVSVDLIITDRGEVAHVREIHGSFEPAAAAAIAKAVYQWRFRPATRNGKPVSVYLSTMVMIPADTEAGQRR